MHTLTPSHHHTLTLAQDQLAGVGSLLFKPGMRLEAKVRLNPGAIGVATIADIKDGQLLIHFDKKSTQFDYWCRPDSTNLHPPKWCGQNGRRVEPPDGVELPFQWNKYLWSASVVPAPAHLFTVVGVHGLSLILILSFPF